MNKFDGEDNDLDFFAEPATVEDVQAGRLPGLRWRGRSSGEGPRRLPGSPAGLVPLARLAGLIALVIAIVVAFVSWVGACQGPGKQAEYAGYLSKVRALAQSSSQLGAEFASKLLSLGLKSSELERSVKGYAERERQAYSQAQQVSVPGPLRSAQQRLLDALELRVGGLAGLSQAFAQALPVKNAASSVTLAGVLAGQAQLLTTSDVVWDQLYRTAATEQIKAQGVSGLVVPESHFITNTDLVSARSFALLLQRLNGVSTGSTPAPAPLLRPGDSGAAVGAWQLQLNRWLQKAQPHQGGLQGGLAITRVFDPPTEAATKTLQRAASITPDGIVGPATRKALRRKLSHSG